MNYFNFAIEFVSWTMDSKSVMKELCRKAMNGDEGALSQLRLHKVDVKVPPSVHLDFASLQREYLAGLAKAAAATKLGLASLELQAIDTVKYIAAIAKAKGFKLDHRLDGSDIAEVMLSFIEEQEQNMACAPVQSDEEEESPKRPQPSNSSVEIQKKGTSRKNQKK